MRKELKLIALLALVLMMVVPATAYSLLYSDDLKANIATSTAYMPNDAFYFRVRDSVGFTNVTHIEVTNVAGIKSVNFTQSGTNCGIYSGITYHGIGSVSSSWSTSRGSYTIDISSFDPLTDVGSNTYKLVCGPPFLNEALIYDMGSQFAASPYLVSPYAVVPSNINNNVPNATFAFYGGVPDPVAVTFTVSDASIPSTRLQGVMVNVSSGVSGATDVNGSVTLSINPPGTGYTFGATKTGYLPASGVSLGSVGSTGGDIAFTLTPSGQTGNTTYILDARDSTNPSFMIAGATLSFQNKTSLAWANITANTGGVEISDILGNALAIGQTIQVCGAASGYSQNCKDVTLPYSGYVDQILLTPIGLTPTNGYWSLTVTTLRDKDRVAIPGVHIEVYSGVNQADAICSGGTDSSGMLACTNMTPSTSASVYAVHQQYNNQYKIVTVVPNASQQTTLYMVLKGDLPVTTPVTPHPTGTPVDPNAPGPYPTPTDASGNPITSSEGRGLAAFEVLADAAYAIMTIVVGLLLIWLLWMSVYLITGGDIIRKMMRRGR